MKKRILGTLLLTGGNSKNDDIILKRLLKQHHIEFRTLLIQTPRIHDFKLDKSRIIKVISLTATSGNANRAIGANPEHKHLKHQNPKFNTFDYRILHYKRYF